MDTKEPSYAHGGMVRKPEVKRASYARGGPVMDRTRDFTKTPDQFRGEKGKFLPKSDFGKK